MANRLGTEAASVPFFKASSCVPSATEATNFNHLRGLRIGLPDGDLVLLAGATIGSGGGNRKGNVKGDSPLT